PAPHSGVPCSPAPAGPVPYGLPCRPATARRFRARHTPRAPDPRQTRPRPQPASPPDPAPRVSSRSRPATVTGHFGLAEHLIHHFSLLQPPPWRGQRQHVLARLALPFVIVTVLH